MDEQDGFVFVPKRWVHFDDQAAPPWDVADPRFATRTTEISDGSSAIYRHEIRDCGGDQRGEA